MPNMPEDTIAAIATPLGEGGIAIVRISGKEAFPVIDRIFQRPQQQKIDFTKTHRLYYGHIVLPKTGETIDEVMVSVMLAPKTYTVEDVAEINCHGGIAAAQKVLECVLLEEGVRLAEAGEFTKRAFLNGRIDLTQGEAVMDMISAKTDLSRALAMNQLKGSLKEKIQSLRKRLLFLMANIEAGVDFPEEMDVQKITLEAKEEILSLIEEADDLLKTAEEGKILREGISAAIVGRTNVGKSSLLNALLKEPRAIVTNIPGTTRDIIEETINLDGIPLRLVDTAGVRDTEDVVEKIGIQKTKEALKKADIVILLLDKSEDLTKEDEEILALTEGKRTLLLLNKKDLTPSFTKETILKRYPAKKEEEILEISAVKEEGLTGLKETIKKWILTEHLDVRQDVFITKARHKELLLQGKAALESAKGVIEEGLPLDLVSIDLKNGYEALGKMIGETYEDDVLDLIFSEFCIGK